MVWWVLHKFAAFYEKTSEALRHKASEVFRSSSQIVVWIKCGFSSPVQLNIFTVSFRKSNGDRLICLKRADGVDNPAAENIVTIDPENPPCFGV